MTLRSVGAVPELDPRLPSMGPGDGDLGTRSILVVDDDELNLLLLSEILEQGGYKHIATEIDPVRIAGALGGPLPDLVLLDVHMPGIDGFELLRRLAGSGGSVGGAPVIVLTADVTETTKRRALSMGARDFLTKPFDRFELLLRVRNVLQMQQLQERLREQNVTLEDQVFERTRELELERLEMLDRLGLAAEFRDDGTQGHARRIGRTCGVLARALGRNESEAELIRRAAQLHDIGKIGIPDEILLKPGKLTPAEFELVKQHTTIGARILSGGRCPVLRLGHLIALSHHERWDGRGYPHGLRGTEIPLEGRIVAVADVFDALTHERPYKGAWPVDEAVAEVLDQAGRQFDPRVVEAFSRIDDASLLGPIEDENTLRRVRRRGASSRSRTAA